MFVNDQNAVINFLYYGYLPRNLDKEYQIPSWLQNIDIGANSLKNLSESELIHIGCKRIKELFLNIPFDYSRNNIVPLSGGLDSRAILAGLIKSGLKDKITTVTFGTPNTFDFEFGNLIAKIAGTKHINIDLTKEIITFEKLLESKKNNHYWTYLFDSYYNKLIAGLFGIESIYWSGFMGDPLAGAHLLPKEIDTWEKAKRIFALNQQFVKSFNLCPNYFNAESILPERCFFDKKKLSFYEQIDFVFRQLNYILPTLTKSGYKYVFPFIEKSWVEFILSVPSNLRKNKKLYKLILQRTYPKFFSLPSTDHPGFYGFSHFKQKIFQKVFPRLGRGTPRTLNYIDFDEAIRKRDDFKTLIYDSLVSIHKMQILPWLDLSELWDKHQKREKNYGDALTMLTSLYVLIAKQNK